MQSYKNKKPLDYYKELEPKEIEIYNELFFNEEDIKNLNNININNILNRKNNIFEDYDYNLPENIFIIKNYHGKIIVGRKIRSILRIENKINAINCSMITAPMLLGFLKKRERKNRKITISYFPFNNEEKKYIFDEIKNNRKYDLYFPYKYRDFYTNLEEKSPENGWSFNPSK